MIWRCKTPSASTFDKFSGMRNYMQRDLIPGQLQHQLLQPNGLVKAAVSSQKLTTLRHYICDFNRYIRQDPIVKVGHYVLVNSLWIVTIASDSAGEMANPRYSKVLRWAPAQYRVLNINLHSVIIEEMVYRTLIPLTALRCQPHRNRWSISHEQQRKKAPMTWEVVATNGCQTRVKSDKSDTTVLQE